MDDRDSECVHVQVDAVPFCERLGYCAEGERFMQAGIEHVRMRRGL